METGPSRQVGSSVILCNSADSADFFRANSGVSPNQPFCAAQHYLLTMIGNGMPFSRQREVVIEPVSVLTAEFG